MTDEQLEKLRRGAAIGRETLAAAQVAQAAQPQAEAPQDQPATSDAKSTQERFRLLKREARIKNSLLSEEGDAQAFGQLFKDSVRFFHRSGTWAIADGESGIWVPDAAEQITRMTSALMVDLYTKAESAEARNWAHAGHSRKRITNCQALARSIAPISVPATDNTWDSHPRLLGVPNGVVDLTFDPVHPDRVPEVRKALPDEKVTMRASVPYDPTARCDLWLDTLREIFTFEPSDDNSLQLPLLRSMSPEEIAGELVAFIQRAFGYTLTGDVREECFFMCWGEGRNGKGTLINTFFETLGDYAANLSMGTLEAHSRPGNGPQPDIAKLPAKRMVTASENQRDVRLDEAMVKRVTGRDPVTVRQMYKPMFTFDPVFKLWMMVNHRPEIAEDDVALWARIHLIPFLRSFDEGRADTTLKDRLKAERPGILAWAVRGAQLWQRNGLQAPAVVKAATRAYRAESDTLQRFINERCVLRPTASTKTSDLLRDYRQWCSVNEIEPVKDQTFTKKLKGRGFTVDETKPKAYTWLSGIGLLQSDAVSATEY